MTDKMTEPARGGEAGYATLAKVLSAWFALDPPLDSRQVHQWHLRGTLNKDGEPFPGPVREVAEPKRGQPRWLFDVPAAIAWYSKGVPDLHGKGWRVPETAGNETTA